MSTESPETIAEWIERTGATKTGTERREENPNRGDWPAGAYHWTITLRLGDRKMSVPFTKGPGLGPEPPEAAEVLACLAMDARSIEDANGFEDWAADFGYDSDSRRAEQIYTAAQRQTAELRAWAGPDYDSLLAAEED